MNDYPAENSWDFELREMELAGLVEAIAKGEVDAGVAALTVTQEREKAVDFTHRFYSSGLGIAVHKASGI